jgi:hypothetical protein
MTPRPYRRKRSAEPLPAPVPLPPDTVVRSTSAPIRTGVQPDVKWRGRNALGPFVPEAQLR